ncbi:hypothetical protein PUN28_008811 [Cardiocondyla obscurior]|uniref:Uncharacterized protein n=1 Tax=Cardiocondyla obscurior TaxID=286306 RepID=A0AAW2FUT9_9HYME
MGKERISEGLDEDISEDDFRPLRLFNIVNDDNGDDDNNANEVWGARANHMDEVEEENENRENPEGKNEEEESALEEDFMTEMQQMFDQMFSEIGDDVITEVTTEIINQTMHCRIFFYYSNDYLFYCIPCFMEEQLLAHEDFKMVRCHRTETYVLCLNKPSSVISAKNHWVLS